MPNTITNAHNPTPAEATETLHGDDELSELAALLGRAAQDTGSATETVRLDTLTPAEKRVILALLRERIGHGPLPAPLSPAAKGGRRP